MSEREPSGRRPPEILINYTEPRIKPPPLLEVGALAWIRKNLFGSWLDILLTIMGVVIIVSFVVGLTLWVIREGNWFSIMFSLRTFTVGRLDQALIPRVTVTLLFVMFTIGATAAAYTRRLATIIPSLMVLIAGVLLLLPTIINAMIPLPDQILAAGNVGIVSGTAQELPIERMSFTARKDETITLRLANDAGFDDRLAVISGLADRSTNTLRNAAANRITTIARGQELLATMAFDVQALAQGENARADTLTPNRRALLLEEFFRLPFTISEDVQAKIADIDKDIGDIEAERPLTDDEIDNFNKKKEALLADNAELVIAPLVTETYNINLLPAQIAIYNAEGTEVFAPFAVEPEGEITFTVPEDGWYVLEKTIPGDTEGITVLSAQGIYPLFQVGERYLRVVDDFEWRGDPPEDTKWITLLDNRYRGLRALDEFLRMYVSPFLDKIRSTVLGSMLAIVLGFVLARGIDRQLSPLSQPHKASLRMANWLLIATPFVVFLFINGIDMLALMAALSWMVGMYWVYHLGTRLYAQFAGQSLLRFAGFVAMIFLSYLLLRFIPVLLYNAEPMSDFIAILLAFPVGLMFLMGLVTGSGETTTVVNRRVTTIGLLAAVLYFLPIILVKVAPDFARDFANILPYTDSNTWGGLLLSLIVTLYGIIFAFPLGILLALGRRSTLPAIRYPSTFIIETVRGTPFIVVLFAGQFLITFLHPSFQSIPAVYRALASTVIFVAAYLAENVRGGLQAIPGGQYEAGRALGIPEWQIMLYVTLPQALRAVIPALVGMFISLFKDTSLLEIVSLSDLSRGVALMVSQNEFRESRQEGLIFITVIYFSISYIMAFVSRRLEESGAGSARRI